MHTSLLAIVVVAFFGTAGNEKGSWTESSHHRQEPAQARVLLFEGPCAAIGDGTQGTLTVDDPSRFHFQTVRDGLLLFIGPQIEYQETPDGQIVALENRGKTRRVIDSGLMKTVSLRVSGDAGSVFLIGNEDGTKARVLGTLPGNGAVLLRVVLIGDSDAVLAKAYLHSVENGRSSIEHLPEIVGETSAPPDSTDSQASGGFGLPGIGLSFCPPVPSSESSWHGPVCASSQLRAVLIGMRDAGHEVCGPECAKDACSTVPYEPCLFSGTMSFGSVSGQAIPTGQECPGGEWYTVVLFFEGPICECKCFEF